MSPATIGTATKPCPGRTRSQKCLLTKGHFGVHQYPPRIMERDIQATVTQFLELDGWRAFRTELTVQRDRGRVVGERGQPDYLYLRYGAQTDPITRVRYPIGQILWIEFKRKGEEPRPDQQKWHLLEMARGAMVLVVDDIDEFIVWYKASGLARRCA